MSKSFAMAGLRIGWLASHDRELLERVAAFKDYTTICPPAPSEIRRDRRLRARETVLARSRAIVAANMALLDAFFAEHAGLHVGAAARRLDRLPAADDPGTTADDFAPACSRPRASCSCPARASATPATTSASASGGPTSRSRSRVSRRSSTAPWGPGPEGTGRGDPGCRRRPAPDPATTGPSKRPRPALRPGRLPGASSGCVQRTES